MGAVMMAMLREQGKDDELKSLSLTGMVKEDMDKDEEKALDKYTLRRHEYFDFSEYVAAAKIGGVWDSHKRRKKAHQIREQQRQLREQQANEELKTAIVPVETTCPPT